jgi:hypothetical protein
MLIAVDRAVALWNNLSQRVAKHLATAIYAQLAMMATAKSCRKGLERGGSCGHRRPAALMPRGETHESLGAGFGKQAAPLMPVNREGSSRLTGTA